MSTNLMLPKGDLPVAWRGPVVSNAIRQFWSETNWGDIDYLFVDMPPGTSDVLLTVFQSLPVDGIVTVSAPQELVAMIVGKAVNLAHDMDVEVLGLVENMAYCKCDDCGENCSHLRRACRAPKVASATTSPCHHPSTRSSHACAMKARSRTTTWKASWTSSSTRSSKLPKSRMRKQRPVTATAATSLFRFAKAREPQGFATFVLTGCGFWPTVGTKQQPTRQTTLIASGRQANGRALGPRA